jgi:hypothetical protein
VYRSGIGPPVQHSCTKYHHIFLVTLCSRLAFCVFDGPRIFAPYAARGRSVVPLGMARVPLRGSYVFTREAIDSEKAAEYKPGVTFGSSLFTSGKP